jgi:hypothetical protein
VAEAEAEDVRIETHDAVMVVSQSLGVFGRADKQIVLAPVSRPAFGLQMACLGTGRTLQERTGIFVGTWM